MSALGWFEGFVLSAGLANLALGVLAVEALLVLVFRARLGSLAASLFVNAATGAALMLIVRAALLGAPALQIAGLFTLAFALHLTDIWVRTRPSPRARSRP